MYINNEEDLTWATLGGGRLSEGEVKFVGRQTASERDRGRPGSRRQLDGAAANRGVGDAPPPPSSNKKFVLVTTQPDGSKKQTILKPNDPRSVGTQTFATGNYFQISLLSGCNTYEYIDGSDTNIASHIL